MRLPLILLSLIVIAGCAPEERPAAMEPAVEPGAGEDPPGAETRFVCGNGAILLTAADVGRIEEAFGRDGIGAKVCAIFADAARRAAAEPQTVAATLPNGETVTARAEVR